MLVLTVAIQQLELLVILKFELGDDTTVGEPLVDTTIGRKEVGCTLAEERLHMDVVETGGYHNVLSGEIALQVSVTYNIMYRDNLVEYDSMTETRGTATGK